MKLYYNVNKLAHDTINTVINITSLIKSIYFNLNFSLCFTESFHFGLSCLSAEKGEPQSIENKHVGLLFYSWWTLKS